MAPVADAERRQADADRIATVTIFIQNDAVGAGAGNLDPTQASVDLGVIANGDTGLGLAPAVGNRQQVSYARTIGGACPVRLDALVNTTFTPDYGAGPQTVNIVILPVLANFVLNDGTSILAAAGVALPPQNSGLPSATLNNTNDCLAIYDTTQNNGAGYCCARGGTGGTLDLQIPNPVILYHELSHARRIANDTLLALTASCNPASPEENAAITEENDLRTQLAAAAGQPAVLRDPGIHCGAVCGTGSVPASDCCIIASVSSGSALSSEVQALRAVRDNFLRSTEVGFAFCENHYRDYYAFSPQVCTLMAREPALRPLVLDGFVRPLVFAFRLLSAHVFGNLTDARLGRLVADHHPDRGDAARVLALLERARAFSLGEIEAGHVVGDELVRLLREHAWPSAHVRWPLVEPVEIYAEALRLYHAGARTSKIGGYLRQAFTSWAVELPLDPVWGSLSRQELERELGIFESRLLRSTRAKARFRKRLLDRFRDVTAIRTVVLASMGAAP
jgi:hypothetical protein